MNIEPLVDCLAVLLIGFGLILGDASLGRSRAARRRQERDARIAELEVGVGIVERDDVAFDLWRARPGEAIPFKGKPPTLRRVDSIASEFFIQDGQRYKRRPDGKVIPLGPEGGYGTFAPSRLPPTHPLLDADMRRKSELQRRMNRGLGR